MLLATRWLKVECARLPPHASEYYRITWAHWFLNSGGGLIKKMMKVNCSPSSRKANTSRHHEATRILRLKDSEPLAPKRCGSPGLPRMIYRCKVAFRFSRQ